MVYNKTIEKNSNGAVKMQEKFQGNAFLCAVFVLKKWRVIL